MKTRAAQHLLKREAWLRAFHFGKGLADMTRRMIIPFLFGIAGAAVLISLGIWQVQRLEWKQTILSQIEARISDSPVTLPATPDPANDKYLPVTIVGRILPDGMRVLTSIKQVGPGHRLINLFETQDGRRVLLDRGFLALAAIAGSLPVGPVTVIGNLHWPQETDSFTPDPDIAKGIWFARDVDKMSATLNAEPVLVIAREITPNDASVWPQPVTIQGIPNDHLQYAITWFLLAIVWLGMTALLLWRIRQKTN